MLYFATSCNYMLLWPTHQKTSPLRMFVCSAVTSDKQNKYYNLSWTQYLERDYSGLARVHLTKKFDWKEWYGSKNLFHAFLQRVSEVMTRRKSTCVMLKGSQGRMVGLLPPGRDGGRQNTTMVRPGKCFSSAEMTFTLESEATVIKWGKAMQKNRTNLRFALSKIKFQNK